MVPFILIFLLSAASFVAGALYGRDAEAKAIAFEIKVAAYVHQEVADAVSFLRARVDSLRKHL